MDLEWSSSIKYKQRIQQTRLAHGAFGLLLIFSTSGGREEKKKKKKKKEGQQNELQV